RDGVTRLLVPRSGHGDREPGIPIVNRIRRKFCRPNLRIRRQLHGADGTVVHGIGGGNTGAGSPVRLGILRQSDGFVGMASLRGTSLLLPVQDSGRSSATQFNDFSIGVIRAMIGPTLESSLRILSASAAPAAVSSSQWAM